MSEYTDMKNNTYRVSELFHPAGATESRREEIMEELFKILSPKN